MRGGRPERTMRPLNPPAVASRTPVSSPEAECVLTCESRTPDPAPRARDDSLAPRVARARRRPGSGSARPRTAPGRAGRVQEVRERAVAGPGRSRGLACPDPELVAPP